MGTNVLNPSFRAPAPRQGRKKYSWLRSGVSLSEPALASMALDNRRLALTPAPIALRWGVPGEVRARDYRSRQVRLGLAGFTLRTGNQFQNDRKLLLFHAACKIVRCDCSGAHAGRGF